MFSPGKRGEWGSAPTEQAAGATGALPASGPRAGAGPAPRAPGRGDPAGAAGGGRGCANHAPGRRGGARPAGLRAVLSAAGRRGSRRYGGRAGGARPGVRTPAWVRPARGRRDGEGSAAAGHLLRGTREGAPAGRGGPPRPLPPPPRCAPKLSAAGPGAPALVRSAPRPEPPGSPSPGTAGERGRGARSRGPSAGPARPTRRPGCAAPGVWGAGGRGGPGPRCPPPTPRSAAGAAGRRLLGREMLREGAALQVGDRPGRSWDVGKSGLGAASRPGSARTLPSGGVSPSLPPEGRPRGLGAGVRGESTPLHCRGVPWPQFPHLIPGGGSSHRLARLS